MSVGLASRTVALLWAMGLAVSFSLASAVYACHQNDWTSDELNHLSWSERLLDSGVTERESRGHYDSKTPVTVLNVLAQRVAAAAGVEAPWWLRFWTRIPNVFWLALLIATSFAMARRLLGAEAAPLATAFVALDPNLIAHSSAATVDVPFAAATLLALEVLQRYAQRPGTKLAIAAGLAIGACFVIKVTAFLTVPLALVLLPLVSGRDAWRGRFLRGTLELALAALAAALLICAAYGFSHVGLRWDEIPLHSRMLGAVAARLTRVPFPLPADFLTAVDQSSWHDAIHHYPVMVLGRGTDHGVWFYFLVVFLVKTPVASLIFLVAGWVALLRKGHDRCVLHLAAFTVLLSIYFSLFFNAQRGYRFVLMCVPIAYFLAASGAARLLAARWGLAAALVGLLSVAGENLGYWGNPIAFTNALVWPKKQVFRLITDSNVDWSQKNTAYARLARGEWPGGRVNPVHILPGINVIKLNILAGVNGYLPEFNQHGWLREHLDPVEHIDHTYLRFDVSEAAFERFLAEDRTLAPNLGTACREMPVWRVPGPAPDGRLFRAGGDEILCIAAEAPIDLALKITGGTLSLCPVEPRDAGCEERSAHAGDEIWYRLRPGQYAFHLSVGPETPGFSWSTRPVVR